MLEGQALHVLSPRLAQRVSLVFFAFMCWSALFLFIFSRPTSQRLVEKANLLNVGIRTHRAELATRSVAMIHASIVACGAGSLVFFREDSNLYVDWRKFTQPLTWPNFDVYNEDALFYACVAAAFFIADLILCVVQYEEYGFQFVVHAAAGLTGCVFCLFSGEGLLYLMLLMLFEVSTPFLHLRWWLIEYGYKNGILYVINGLILVFTFTLFRLVIGVPVLMKMVYELHTAPERDRHGLPMRITFTVAPVIMTVLNVAWGSALWKGLLKAVGILGRSKAKKGDHADVDAKKAS